MENVDEIENAFIIFVNALNVYYINVKDLAISLLQ